MSRPVALSSKVDPRTDRQPVIPAGLLCLRPWQPADAAQVVQAFRDPEIREWHSLPIETELEARKWMTQWRRRWRAETGAAWAITASSNPSILLGQVAFRVMDLHAGMAECSYWVLPEYRGVGIAPTATRALSEWAFDQLNLRRLEIAHSVRNRQSCRVALKAGFGPEGIKKSLQRCEHGGVHDMHLHARVRRADTPARPWDRALLDLESHNLLCIGTLLFGAATAYLGRRNRYTPLIPLIIAPAVPLVRAVIVGGPYRKHQRQRPLDNIDMVISPARGNNNSTPDKPHTRLNKKSSKGSRGTFDAALSDGFRRAQLTH
jgi:[ribosomal protein S5]-alanine N-acetyltransferase